MSQLALMGAGPTASAAGGGGAFTPASVAGLIYWWDFSTLAGADASAIASISDLSGNGHTLSQATGANQPLVAAGVNGINGLKVAKFDGVNDSMATAAFASPTAGVSVFAVVQYRIAPSTFQHVVLHNATAGWASPFARYCIRSNTANHWDAWANDAANVFSSTSTVPATALVHGLVYNQANEAQYNNGAADGTGALTGVLTSSTFPVVVGTQGDAVTGFLDGKIGEIVAYDNGISAGNIASLSTYFRNKWGTP